jgi:transcriptional regulator with PAS, ATPase and Fis domain
MREITAVIREEGREPRRLQLQRLRLVVTSGQEVGLSRSFDHDILRIGSLEDNNLVLRDPTVSRRHAELRRSAEGLLLVDLGSTNGTFVGGVRLREVFLGDRRSFRVGKTEIEVRVEDETIEIQPAEVERFNGLVGRSVALREVFSLVQRIGPTGLTVLVTGETGTGKELVSRAVHLSSPRAQGPLVVFDCGAVARNLLESELFGHERGAFTGADRARPGVFEQAQGGTIFLDELGELPLELQPVLLRVLEQREVRRVGDRRARPVDVRVVAATNRDLRRLVEEGQFREDLYYRVAVVELKLPALRDRLEDLDLLIPHLLSSAPFPHQVVGVDSEVLDLFRAYHWPGNVRELRNVLLRAVPFCDGDRIDLASLPESFRPVLGEAPGPAPEAPSVEAPRGGAERSYKEAREELLESFERQYLQELLERCQGNLSLAARESGVDRKTIARMLKRHGIRHAGGA